MAASCSPVRFLIAIALFGLTGCHAVDYYEPSLQRPMPEPLMPPTEKSPVSQASYRVEPPDLLSIEMLKQVPRPPYRIDIYDVLEIHVVGTPREQPIDGFFLVEAEGTITLGPSYGRVRIAGMTIDEATDAVTKKLKETLREPAVSLQFSRSYGSVPVSGEYLIGPDGTINLRKYGMLKVAGKTITEIRQALRKQLEQYFDSPEVAVEVRQYNSKVYYVITQGAGQGDNIHRFQVTGNDTVLDALATTGGLSPYSSMKIWVARPAPADFGCQQILPVDYEAIVKGASSATNYQLMPGDRVFIAEDNLVAFNTYIGKLTAPVERLFGIMSVSTSAIRSSQTMGRDYNRLRSGL